MEEVTHDTGMTLVLPMWEMFNRIFPEYSWIFFDSCNAPLWFDPNRGTILK